MKELGKRVLLVEEDKNLAFAVKDFLELAGYEVILKESGMEGLKAFGETNFDLCIFDILLPVKEGLVPAAGIRQQDPAIPIMFFTSQGLTESKIIAFKTNDDEHITSPFSIEEFLMRMKRLMPEIEPQPTGTFPECYAIGRYVFYYDNHILKFEDQQTILSKKECELLRLLGARQNQLVKREEALISIWGENSHSNSRSMDVFLTKLRKRFHNDPSVTITNMHGVGFMLETGAKSA
ncbi:MAG: response regulator transcription factor [Bacteroidales bacterium]